MAKVEKIDSNKVVLEVEVPEPEVEKALSMAYRNVVKKVNVPGFRRGRAPRRVLEARFGPEVLYEDALNFVIPRAYERAVDETNIEPVEHPDVEVVQMEKGKPLLFKATVEVKPEVKLGEYKGVEIEKKEEKVTEEDVDRYLEQLRQRHARLFAVEEGAISKGDLAVIDFTGYIDGEPFEGGEGENYSLEIGGGTFIPGFEDQLIGAEVREEREVRVTFPEDYSREDLAGKEATFKIKVKEIKRKELPELNDDFVKEISDMETLEEFRADAKKKLEEEKEKQQKVALESALIEKISSNSEVDVPENMINRELDKVLQQMEFYLKTQGLDMEKYLEYTGKELSDLKEEHREEAVNRIKGNLVIDAIIKKEGFEVEAEEIDEHIKKMSEAYKKDPADMKEFLIKQGQMERIKAEILYRKTIDFLLSHANIKVTEEESKSA